ncbi:SDR family oxidoreductase [Aldersonia sp. NBC_00410]|uniref:SDR family NAD(P)-dependent oxidoreductase n=1 Tax=Aldersonia sp. NBC_00410 TaxID=2975954 RepID=UPI0022559AA0|nr:SDR family NAD(P)-dependent oxidoreductase [Aldersonia sp. NBC_00410]MCX5046100.1 SDR family oxidoreductase [Aldersonia sp. NBC_00410]
MTNRNTALITGASAGLGRALSRQLITDGWRVIGTARGAQRLQRVGDELGPDFLAVPGDITDPVHRTGLGLLVGGYGGLDLLVNNASRLGPSPMPRLERYPLDEFGRVFDTNVIAPLDLIQILLPALRAADGVIMDISSDAAVAAYPGWGGYGASKAALDQLGAVLAEETPELRVYAVDPGDMRTQMHQAAFPGEDISDRPEPATVVPALLRLLGSRPPSGRYVAADLAQVPA